MRDRMQPYFLLIALLGVFALTFFIFQPFLSPLSLSVVFAVVLHPLFRRFSELFKGRNSLAALATVCIAVFILFIPVFILGSQLLLEAQQLYGGLAADNGASISRAFASFAPTAERYLPGSSVYLAKFSTNLGAYSQSGLTWLIQHLGTAFSSLATILLDLFLFVVALYYLLRDGESLRAHLIELSPLNDRDDIKISDRLVLAIHSVVMGRLAIALLQGALTGIGFALFGVPNAILWSIVAAVASLVPPVGTSLVVIPGALYLALTGHVGLAIGLAIWGAIAVGTVDNMLGPMLMSGGTQLHPLLVMLSLLGGIAFFGPVGIFLGPLTVSLLITLLSIYRHTSRVESAADGRA